MEDVKKSMTAGDGKSLFPSPIHPSFTVSEHDLIKDKGLPTGMWNGTKLRGKNMGKAFSEQAERSIIESPHCRVAVYPAVRGWMSARVQIEFSNTADGLGIETTPGRGGGHYLVEGATAEEVAKAASKLRGKPVEVVHVE